MERNGIMKRISLIFVALLSIVANAQQFRVLTTSDRILETDPLFSAWFASYVPPVTDESDPVWQLASTNVVSVAGGPSSYITGRFPVWDGSTWIQSAEAPVSSTGSVSTVNLGVGTITISAGDGIEVSNSVDTQDRTITISAVAKSGNYSTAEMMTAGVTNEVAASETGNAHYFLELSQPSWVTFTGFTTNMSAVVMLEVKGTNSLTVTSDGGSVDWTGNVWLRDGVTVPIMFTKPTMSTNWIGSETL